jgi:hypothetical protein
MFDFLHILTSVLYGFKQASGITSPINRKNHTVSNLMLNPLRACISAFYSTQYTSPHVKACFGNGFLEISHTLYTLYTRFKKTVSNPGLEISNTKRLSL